ncbi:MAG: hypothetical protein K2M19_08710 [Muribaculaceae bacterium]|nr:hypothetical protein [Muribaculaceae bacterium]
MNKYQILILIVCSVIAFIVLRDWGLYYDHMEHLTEQDLTWIEDAKKFSPATFENSSGDKAYYKVSLTRVENSRNPFYLSHTPGSEYNPVGIYYFTLKIGNSVSYYSFSLTRFKDPNSLYFSSRSRYSFDLKKDRTLIPSISEYIPKDSIEYSGDLEIDNQTIKNCILLKPLYNEIENPRLEKTDSANKVYEFCFSKEYGLLYFILENGETFFRKFQ